MDYGFIENEQRHFLSNWLGGRDSNPDNEIQNLASYHWTTSQNFPFQSRIFRGEVQPIVFWRIIRCDPFGSSEIQWYVGLGAQAGP